MPDETIAQPEEASVPPGNGGERYDADAIKVLQGLEAVRKRPGMYIGDTGTKGLHHLVFEVVDNSVDEAMAGVCTTIGVRIHADGTVSVVDDGRGIPVDLHKEEGRSALDVVMTTLHAGGKFDQKSYSVSAGLHGVGVSAVNALSEWLTVDVWRDGYEHFQRYERGKPAHEVQKRGRTTKRGTRVTFKPDPGIFTETLVYSFDILVRRLRELAFLNRGLAISIADERDGKGEEFKYDGGIRAFVEHLNLNKKKLHEDIIYFEKTDGMTTVEIALQYNDGYNETVFSFANSINTHDGGTHLSGFRNALTRTLNAYGKGHGLFKEKDPQPSGEDYRVGLVGVVNVRLPNPQFESQTKVKLTNTEVEGKVTAITNDMLEAYMEEHPATAQLITMKAVVESRAREEARLARDAARRKTALSSGDLPGKLADCSSRDKTTTELYIVEGESAGGSAKQGRDRKFQAILPLKGKILNVEKAREYRLLKHEEIRTLISAIGTGIGADFNLERRRYGRVIIMTDADVDGSHIRTLLLTFFFRHMLPLIEDKRVFVAQPPLYKVKRKKKEMYVHSEKEMRGALVEMGLEGTGLEVLGRGETMPPERMRALVEVLQRLEDHAAAVQRKGTPFDAFLMLKNGAGQLPVYRVRHDATEKFIYSSDEFNAFIRDQAKAGHEFVIRHDELPEGENGGGERLEVSEFHESRVIEATVRDLEAMGFRSADYVRVRDADAKPLYRLKWENASADCFDLKDVLGQIGKIGQKGLDMMQRFKGLGEMNAEQLWETTMDPAKRTLVRVSVEDGVKADRIFTILMGDEVEPRRDFIEKHALEVKNLDI